MVCLTGRLVVGALGMFLALGTAFGHVTVWPKVSRPGAFEKYTVRVPTEGKVATVAVELEIPAGATFLAVGTAVGHTYELKKSGERVVAVAWKMRIGPGEFSEFSFMARNPEAGSDLVWRATQRFADGTSTQWIGAPGTPRPASVTRLSG